MHKPITLHLGKEITDNTITYLDLVITAVEYSCPGSIVDIRKMTEDYQVTITPSNTKFKQAIIDNILHLHHSLKLKITFSKSLKISKKISYRIELV